MILLELGDCYSKSRIVDLINRLSRTNVVFPNVREAALLSVLLYSRTPLRGRTRLTRSCYALARPFESALSTKPLAEAYVSASR